MYNLQGSKEAPLSIFISYAHEDEHWRQQLEAHLSLLRRQGLVADWHDRQIMPGAEWSQEIDEHLEMASIILLLISADFLASDYCYDKEMQRALERHQHREARVIPIIMRPCDWQSSPFARLQSLPRDGKAITTWQNQDEAFLAIVEGLRRVIERQQMPARPLEKVEQQNRTQLMKRVWATWIEGVLEHSLHQAALITLDLQEQPDALVNPWNLTVQETNLPPHSLPAGTSIVQAYDEADGDLLILGEPGVGKTTLLLELARALLERAEKSEQERLPVVFNLSSWAQEQQSLAVWLLEELWTKYQVPRKVGQTWIDSDQVLLLLDGLDEVSENARSACVQAINDYYHRRLERGPNPLVVCCRSQEYKVLPTRFKLHRAVSIQPFTDEQIEHYLQSVGDQLEALRLALRSDPELYELARRPLMLSIFTLAYQEATLVDLPVETPREAKLPAIFDRYVERMLTRRGSLRMGTPEQIRHWLDFLAKQLHQHQETVFSVEGLQPDWCPEKQRLLYRWSLGLGAGLLFGPPLGLLGGLIAGPFAGLFLGLLVSLTAGLLTGFKRKIQPVEVLSWSWKDGRLGLLAGLPVGLVCGLLVGLHKGLLFGLLSGLLVGLAAGFLFGLLAGLSGKQLTRQVHLSPNQSIWRSARNGLLGGLAFGLLGGLVSSLIGILVGGQSSELLLWLLDGFIGGLVFGGLLGGLILWLLGRPGDQLSGGLTAFIQHFILRFFLWRTGSLPWNTIAFLDEAAERLLLRKVGSSYIFTHRLLLDYFASLEKKEP